ncbi:MAG TPA: hypothetical protein VD929_11900 [Caulobacteraceae bacterium]|nr:hypothetical protein [Caulobacteraceae bacterium]
MHDGTAFTRALTRSETLLSPRGAPRMPWVQVAPDAPYFVTEDGAPWTPIGQNDAITWLEFRGLWGRTDLDAFERHVTWLRDSGVTVMRLMLEYAQYRKAHFERPIGRWRPEMVRLWDDVVMVCERVGMRLLLTPVDTFWTWLRWDEHPWNSKNGGVVDSPSRLLLDAGCRQAIKDRLSFMVERWGGSGAIFAWDLWNEIHPAQSEERADEWPEFIHDLSRHVRELELRLFGRTHLQTVSLFGPELRWRAHLPMRDPIFRHPDLDFATVHFYAEGAIDDPVNTVDCAPATAELVRECLAETPPGRPFLDSEHGPIHGFKDKKITLPAAFDDEYFRHMQWAHLAAGGAGGGMRWPNRHPHVLTRGMRRAQAATTGFLGLIDWPRLRRVNLNAEVGVEGAAVHVAACGDPEQAAVWLLRRDTVRQDGTVDRTAAPVSPKVTVPGLEPGRYRVTGWDTLEGREAAGLEAEAGDDGLTFVAPAFAADLALAVRRI